MAHLCPECDEVCYCGGDTDKEIRDEGEYWEECIHCPIDGMSIADIEEKQ